MNITLPHGTAIVSGIVGILGVVAAFNPVLIAPFLATATVAKITGATAAAGALLAAYHAATHTTAVAPNSDPVAAATVAAASKQAGFVSLRGLLMLLSAAIVVAALTAPLAGCASLATPQGQAVLQDAVSAAVIGAELKGVQAAQINGIAKVALAADAGASATLSTVAGLVDGQLAKLKLPPADQVAADLVVASLASAISAKVGSNATLAQVQAGVADVLRDVIAATGG